MDVLSQPVREKVAAFGDERGLVGILTAPVPQPVPYPHVILLNAGIIHRVGPNRLMVNLARALGAIGVTSLRFDLSGIGDSERRRTPGSLRESVEQDITAAMDHVAAVDGADRFLLMGLCSGAYDALHAARRDPRVVGALMVDLAGPFKGWRHTLHHLRARLLRLTSWRNPFRKFVHHSRALVGPARDRHKPEVFIVGGRSTPSHDWLQDQLDALLARGVRLCFVFTGGMPANYNHQSQFRTSFPRAARHPAVRYDFFPDADHSFTARQERDRLLQVAVEWVSREPFPDAAPIESRIVLGDLGE